MSVIITHPNDHLITALFYFLLQKNSKGFNDFAVRRIKHAQYGRREIEIAEQGGWKNSFEKKRILFFYLIYHYSS